MGDTRRSCLLRRRKEEGKDAGQYAAHAHIEQDEDNVHERYLSIDMFLLSLI
jgi:hypothetical protein